MANDRLAVALSLRNAAPTQYQEWNFNSMCRFGDVYLGANEDGLYSLGDKADDAGTAISAYLETKATDFNVAQERLNFLRAELGLESGGNLTVSVKADDGNWDAATLRPTTGNKQSHAYVDLNRGVRGRYFAAKVANTSGCDFSVDRLDLISQARKRYVVFAGTSGLNNRIDPARITYDAETGIQDLQAAVNVDVDDSLRVGRRRGYTLRQSGNFHSLWSDGERCFVMKDRTATNSDGALYLVNPDYSLSGLRSALSPTARMSFVSIGGWTYYANGIETGVVKTDDASYTWSGTTPSTSDLARYQFHITTTPPKGHLLSAISQYILIADGGTLYWSVPGAYSWFRLARDRRRFATDIQMLAPVEDGVWVSDATATYYLAGLDPNSWQRVRKASYPAIRGTATTVDGSLIGSGDLPGPVAIWASTKGICVGGPQGTFINLTEQRLTYPTSNRGAGVVIEGVNANRYVMTLEP